jgi:putative membrane protein
MTSPRYPLRVHLGLSDRLALERTRLAYLRTGMALVIAGFSMTEFFRSTALVWIGVLFVPVGLSMLIVGWVRFRRKQATVEADIAASLGADEPEAG